MSVKQVKPIRPFEVWDNLDEWIRTTQPPYHLQNDSVYLTGMLCELYECDSIYVEPHVLSWIKKG